jgi:hypothetical protein
VWAASVLVRTEIVFMEKLHQPCIRRPGPPIPQSWATVWGKTVLSELCGASALRSLN